MCLKRLTYSLFVVSVVAAVYNLGVYLAAGEAMPRRQWEDALRGMKKQSAEMWSVLHLQQGSRRGCLRSVMAEYNGRWHRCGCCHRIYVGCGVFCICNKVVAWGLRQSCRLNTSNLVRSINLNGNASWNII